MLGFLCLELRLEAGVLILGFLDLLVLDLFVLGVGLREDLLRLRLGFVGDPLGREAGFLDGQVGLLVAFLEDALAAAPYDKHGQAETGPEADNGADHANNE